jgi:sugar lactone lactonase YvrE
MAMKRWLRRFALALAAAVAALVAWLGLVYGGGRPYPDLTSAPLLPESALETVVTFEQPIGNVAVSAEGRIFFTVHPESRPAGPKLYEWAGGKAVPFPAADRQEDLFETPLGVVIDHRGWLWTIDHGFHGLRHPRLLAFDLGTGEVMHDHGFDRREAPRGSFLQDLQVDPVSGAVYIADVSFFRRQPAIVVYEPGLRGRARRVLEGDDSVSSQDWLIRNPAKTMRFVFGLVSLKIGIDGLAVARDGTWLAWGAMTHDTLYRAATADLRDAALAPEEVASRIRSVGAKPLNDGLSTDRAGNVLITDVEHGAVLRMAPDGRLETLIRSPRIRWADALSFGPAGWLYVADSAIPDQMLRSRRHMRGAAPYFIYRFHPGVDGPPGQ